MKAYIKESIQALEYTWNRVNSFTPIIVVLILALVYLYHKENSLIKRYIVFPYSLFFLVMLNPIIEWLLVYKLGLMARIHRFFWIIPITFLLAYVTLEIFEYNGKRLYFLLIFIFGIWGVLGRTIYEEPHYKTENIYKIQNDVLEMSEKIKMIDQAKEYKVFINDKYINYTIRQYDPSFLLIERPEYLEEIMLMEDLEEYCNSNYFYVLTSYFQRHYQVNMDVLIAAIEYMELDYLILDYAEQTLVEKAYIELVAETGNYYIYKVV